MASQRTPDWLHEPHSLNQDLYLNAALSDLERAILLTIAYADIFDHPLTIHEIHRYLIGVHASRAVIESELHTSERMVHVLARVNHYIMFKGRETLFETRHKRATYAARLWPLAIRYGMTIGRLPFVRMVAVTGSLAVNNVDVGADIDYLIITEPGRLWLCRALIIALVKLAARRGHILCPNYILSEHALTIREESLYTARELMQMVPIVGLKHYERMLQENPWTRRFLPNAQQRPHLAAGYKTAYQSIRGVAEGVLRSPIGGWLEDWEMKRKIRKFSAKTQGNMESYFNHDCCKGHFERHGNRTLSSFNDRRRQIESMEAVLHAHTNR